MDSTARKLDEPPLGSATIETQASAAAEPVPLITAVVSMDASILDAISKDLHLELWKESDDGTLKLPLAPAEWSFFREVRPYAALSPSVVRPLTDSGAALASPSRETSDDPWKGLGVGAGLKWRLSDRLDLFGQYQFMNLPGANTPTSSPFLRRDVESPGLKGGFSIHF